MRSCLIVAVLIFAAVIVSASEKFPLWGELKPGIYDVGFTLRSQYDYSRAFRPEVRFDGKPNEGETARPVQILVWYPASLKNGAKRMRYRDYVHLSRQELRFEKLGSEERRESEADYINGFISARGYNRKALEWLMGAATGAAADAPGVKGKFPLIIYGPGSGGAAFDNSILCEYLASHGYVVAAIPSIGAYTRTPNVDLQGFNSYARDMEFAIAAMHGFPNADAGNVAIAGFSMGGSASTLLQMRNMNIHGAVYFDTGLPYRAFFETHFKDAPEWDKTALRAPQLYFVRRTKEVDPEFAKDIPYAEIYTLSTGREFIRHNDFTADGMFAGTIPGLFPDNAADRKALYEALCLYTLNFLNGYLKDDPKGIEFLNRTPEKNGVPDGLMELSHKRAKAAPPRRSEIMEILETDGASKFREIYGRYREAQPEAAPIAEDVILGIGFLMLSRGELARAIDVFEMSIQMYPASATGPFSLSEAHETAGNREKSLLNAEKALELLSADTVIPAPTRNAMRQMLEARIHRLKMQEGVRNQN